MTRRHRRTVSIGVLVGLAWTVARVAVPELTGRAVDQGILANHAGALVQWSLLILVAGAFSGVCTGYRRYLAFKVAYGTETELRQGMFANLQRLHFAFHDTAQTGQLMARSATDLQQINNFLVMVPISLANVLAVVLITAVLLATDVDLALLSLGSLPLLNLAAKRFSNRLHPVSMSVQQELASLSSVVEETVTGIRAVKGFGAESSRQAQLGARADGVFDRIMALARIRAAFNPVLDFLPALGLLAVVWYGGIQVIEHHLSIGQLVEFNIYLVMLVVPLRSIGQVVATAQRAVASSQRVDEILSASPAVVDRPHALALPSGGGEVRFREVGFGYGSSSLILDGFDLTIPAGQAVALVGPTGSGKTTVARLVPRFYDVDTGRVTIDGVDVRDLRLVELRRSVGIVFEDTFLFSDTVGANIAFAEPEAPMERVIEAARLAGAHDFISSLPAGYETELGERGFSLSGGQRQRIALARAILADPRILILDDATSSVDPTKEHEIRAALAEVMVGRTTIVIAHRPATIALAQRVVVLDQGRIIADGTHSGLLATSERYRQILAQASEPGPEGAAPGVEAGAEAHVEAEVEAATASVTSGRKP